ncbi:aldehyde dehydrogenase [Paenibacillus sp. GCM10027626]|uniref:aldehyde dehydrogenase n=1 Tax=Paenibacillus sp. GCM10027626 TaxID=3273411 RepID=UPI003626887D
MECDKIALKKQGRVGRIRGLIVIANQVRLHEIEEIVREQQRYFAAGKTKPLASRAAALKQLKQAVQEHEKEIMASLYSDLNKSDTEAYLTEIGFLYQEINLTLKRLKRWAKPRKVKTALTHIGSTGWIRPEPYGTVLIIAPWNYPVQLALAPLIGAIAAGNTAIIKPSELTPHVSRTLAELISSSFPPEHVAVIEGDVEVSQLLLEQPVDYIFFTGSTAIGKEVMAAAARRLIPVTLELGGKSPCIVHYDADVPLAARRIVFGKLMNAGQTCVAPDYLLVHRRVKQALLSELKSAIEAMYGTTPLQSDRYGKIVNRRHFERLLAYLQEGEVVVGGEADEVRLKIAPALLDCVDWDDRVMQEEIFGPILPVITYDDIEDVINDINYYTPKPLALYLFTTQRPVQERIVEAVSFGGGCINDTLMHLATPYLPFGGVGGSGLGSYHGEYSFRTFSHYKSVLKQTTKFDFRFRYPSDKNRLSLWKKLMK